MTHEVEGSHAIIGADLARRYGEHPDVVHAIEAHHNEVEVRTVEAVLTAADAIRWRPAGGPRESIEAYVQRLERLEEIAGAREGVEKVFACRPVEVRVMVAPTWWTTLQPRSGARHRQTDRRGTDLSGADQSDGGPRIPGYRDGAVASAAAGIMAGFSMGSSGGGLDRACPLQTTFQPPSHQGQRVVHDDEDHRDDEERRDQISFRGGQRLPTRISSS